MNSVSATPAYGRDYKSKAEVLKDFFLGKDFTLCPFNSSNVYFNISEVYEGGFGPNGWEGKEQKESFPYTHINFRYKKQAQVCVFDVAKQKMT